MKILVIDQSAATRKLIRQALADLGCDTVTEACDGETGVGLLFENSFDLVILERDMADLDGLECIKAIRSSPEWEVPILVLISQSSQESIVEALRAGVNGYLIKPFTAATASRKIELLLESRKTPKGQTRY